MQLMELFNGYRAIRMWFYYTDLKYSKYPYPSINISTKTSRLIVP